MSQPPSLCFKLYYIIQYSFIVLSRPKYAISAIKKRFYNQNPYVALYALQVMESVVKNCGSPIHDEVASKAFMDELREMVHKTTNDKVRSKVLELVQTWAYAFRNTPKYSILPVCSIENLKHTLFFILINDCLTGYTKHPQS